MVLGTFQLRKDVDRDLMCYGVALLGPQVENGSQWERMAWEVASNSQGKHPAVDKNEASDVDTDSCSFSSRSKVAILMKDFQKWVQWSNTRMYTSNIYLSKYDLKKYMAQFEWQADSKSGISLEQTLCFLNVCVLCVCVTALFWQTNLEN